MDRLKSEMEFLKKITEGNKKSKLSKSDQKKCTESLSVLMSNMETLDFAMETLFLLPAHEAAEAFLIAWSTSDDSYKGELIARFLSHKYITDAKGVNRCLPIARGLVEDAPEITLKILAEWCGMVTRQGQHVPSPQNIKHFNNEMLSGNLLNRLNLEEQVNARQMSSIALVVLYSLLSANPTMFDPDYILGYLEWINGAGVRVSFNSKISKKFLPLLANWPEALFYTLHEAGIFTDVKKEFPSEMRMVAVIQSPLDLSGDVPSYEASTPSVSVQEETTKKEADKNGNIIPEHLAIKTMLWTVQNYVDNLEKQVEHLNRYKAEAHEYQKKYNHERNHRMNIQTKFQDSTDILAANENKISQMHNEMFELTERFRSMEEDIHNTKAGHEETVNTLLTISEDRNRNAVNEFKNSLQDALRIEYIDFISVINEDVTPELADNFKAQLRNIFNILKGKGMRF